MCEEFVKLHDVDIFLPIKKDKLTKEQRKSVLRAVSVVKEKTDGALKGRDCADSVKQRQWCYNQQVASPAAHANLFVFTAAIEAKEGRDAATYNIKGVCLHEEQDDFTVIKFSDE